MPAIDERGELAYRTWLCQRENLQRVKHDPCGFLADLREQLTIAIDAALSHRRFS